MHEKRVWVYPLRFGKPRKAPSVKLLKGFVSKNPGRVVAKRCNFCHSRPELVAVNFGDPRIRLYGCRMDGKCKKILIRFDMASTNRKLL